ncbi:MAG: VOC family protein [Acidimicrobiales bacterium]|nr:VOC family protein [Acidimicrobiales bacterium]
MTDRGVTVNHVGQCVSDLDRARAFYEAFGFAVVRELEVPDAAGSLLRLDPPIGMRVVYLERDGFVLELMHFADRKGTPASERPMDQPGLTHLSLGVDDLGVAKATIRAHGGEVLEDTDVGVAVFARDPDGQLLELLTGWTKPTR